MDPITDKVARLKAKISATEAELRRLKIQVAGLETSSQPPPPSLSKSQEPHQPTEEPPQEWRWPLKEEEYARYGRQLILPSVGIQGQLRLRSAAVLIVGAGGLGCPAAAYLAGAGVGTLGVVDGDVVEVSNLHRQIAHSTSRVSHPKVDSLLAYCRDLNPGVRYIGHPSHLTPENAEEIVRDYDVVLDCTDHPTSRYLISDICVLLKKLLVSASALRTDGQLIVLNNPPAPQGSTTGGGPCYRCVFPRPPPADSVVSCGEGGILGPVVGVMGVLQALEAIKLLVAGPSPNNEEQSSTPPTAPSLLLFSANSATPFRSMRMRGRRPDCFACSSSSTLTLDGLRSGSLDYVQFCGVTAPVDILRPEERISAAYYNSIRTSGESEMETEVTVTTGKKGILLDVREKEHFDVANIPGAINVPYSTFQAKSSRSADPNATNGDAAYPDWLPNDVASDAPIYVVCRVGNDSQMVTRKLKDMGLDKNGERFIGDIKGGMRAWKQEIDRTMPFT